MRLPHMSLQYITALVNLSMQIMYTYYTHILDMLQYKCILNQLMQLYIISCPEWHTARAHCGHMWCVAMKHPLGWVYTGDIRQRGCHSVFTILIKAFVCVHANA